MRKINYSLNILWWVMLIGFLLEAKDTMAQKQGSSVQIGEFTQLTLGLQPVKSSFVPLEPIPLRLKLTNNTSFRITTHGNLNFSSSFVKIFVQKPSGSVEDLGQLSYGRCRCFTKNGEMLPGAVIESPGIPISIGPAFQ